MSTHLGSSQVRRSPSRDDGTSFSARMSRSLQRSGDYMRDNSNQLRAPEFVIFGAMVFAIVIPGVNQLLSQIAVIIGALYGLTRPPQYELGKFKALKSIMWLGLVYILLVSLLNEHSADAFDWRQRIIRMIFTTILLWNLAEGRLHFRSAIAGYLTALVINIPAFYLGLTERSDGFVLVGFLHDKNYAGLAYAVFGVLAFAIMRTAPQRVFAFILGTSAVWLTSSRTSITAYIVGVLWILLAARFGFIVRTVLLGGVWGLVQLLAEDYSQVGQFASRVGSDMLRERIDAVAQEKAEAAGLFGSGLGEAYAPLQARNWVYHNSYLVLRTEGGWIWAAFVVAVTIIVGMRIFASKTSWTLEEKVAQGASLALLICGLSLGEVFYTFTWAIVIAYAVRAGAIARNRELGMPGYEADNFVGVDRRIEPPKPPEKLTAYIANRVKNS